MVEILQDLGFNFIEFSFFLTQFSNDFQIIINLNFILKKKITQDFINLIKTKKF